MTFEAEIEKIKGDLFQMSLWIGKVEGRVAELEEVVTLQSQLILELNKRVGKGPAASEGIPGPVGESSGPRFSRKD